MGIGRGADTARELGVKNVYDPKANIQGGAKYLKRLMTLFDNDITLAVAAYNAGPSRSRNWRKGPVLEAAIWAENIPFTETRDYVKKVLANTTLYAAILTGEPQSLKSRLGKVGPIESSELAGDPDLP